MNKSLNTKVLINSTLVSFAYNGMLKDDEIQGVGNSYMTEFRQYDARLGKWTAVDPMAKERVEWTPYNSFRNNPVSNIDPNGDLDDEFDKNGNKISDLGGDKIDFYHQENGDTKIVERSSGKSNIIPGGEKLIKNHTQRDNKIGWYQIFNEWDFGIGPEKSLISDFKDTKNGVFESLDEKNSTYTSKARKSIVISNKSSGNVNYDYSEINPFTANDMWEQMLGRTSLSWYKVGETVLYVMTDEKTMTSWAYRLSPSWKRSDFRPNGNTRQTYIWTESIKEIKTKAK